MIFFLFLAFALIAGNIYFMVKILKKIIPDIKELPKHRNEAPVSVQAEVIRTARYKNDFVLIHYTYQERDHIVPVNDLFYKQGDNIIIEVFETSGEPYRSFKTVVGWILGLIFLFLLITGMIVALWYFFTYLS